MDTINPIGEIVESSTMAFVAQCLELPRQALPRLYDPPPFGSFVKISKPSVATASAPAAIEEDDPFASPPAPVSEAAGLPAAVYALVFGAATASIEANRRPSALGLDEEEIPLKQPQIFELLRTDFSCLLIAHSTGDEKGLRRHLPPVPPRIHARVYPCSELEIRALTEDLSFLRGILLPTGGVLSGVPGDELAAACLRQARDVQRSDQQFLLRAGRTLAGILADDYERLQAILRNVI